MHDGVHLRLMVTRGVKRTPYQDPRVVVGGPTVVIIPEYKQPPDGVHERGHPPYEPLRLWRRGLNHRESEHWRGPRTPQLARMRAERHSTLSRRFHNHASA